MFSEHDAKGSANTMRGFQAERPSLYDFEADIRKIEVPTLIVVGDEDEPCLEPSFLLKQWIPTSGLVVLPKTGHVVNQEEPALFNEAVGRLHRPRRGRPLAGARSAVVPEVNTVSCPGCGAARSAAKWCTADPRPFQAWNSQRSRVCIASPRYACVVLRPGHGVANSVLWL